MNKYKVGTKLKCNDVLGTVIENFKLPEDICIEWENGMRASYDISWLAANTEIVLEVQIMDKNLICEI